MPQTSAAFDWTSILNAMSGLGSQSGQQSGSGKTGGSSTIGNLLEGVFSTSDIEVKDMAGVWTVDGSAVSFKSSDFLSKAGGLAAAAAIESKIDPYYKQYGLTGAEITIQPDGACTIKMKRGTMKGTIEKASDGNFIFRITMLGMNISSIPMYVQKTSRTLDMMFDAEKLKELLSLVGRFTGSKSIDAISSILNSYDGIYVGFGTTKTGSVEQENGNPLLPGSNSGSGSSSGTGVSSSGNSSGTGLGTLMDILNSRKKKKK